MKSSVTKYYILSIIILFAIVLQISHAYLIYHKTQLNKQTWLEYNQSAANYNKLLLQLKGYFGYGGFIHHFKNYVLRKDRSREPLIESNLRKIFRVIDKFDHFNLNAEEKKAILQIREVANEYQFKYNQNNYINDKDFIKKNTHDIDNNVKVNDTKALNGFLILEQSIDKRMKHHENEAHKTIMETNQVIFYGLFFVAMTIILAIVIILYLKKMTFLNNQLEDSRNYANTLLNVAPNAILTSDDKGNILSANLQASILFGYTCSELKTSKMYDLFPQEYRQEYDRVMHQFIQNFELFKMNNEMDIFAINHQKQLIHVAMGVNSVNINNKIVIVYIIRDLTRQKQFENQIILAKIEAEKANHAKSIFLANMSHEIRTPMNAIIGLNHLLQKTALTQKQLDYAVKVERSAQNLLGIINDILDFSKIEAGKLDIDNMPFYLNTVLDNMAYISSPKIDDQRIEVIIDVDKDVPLDLIGDPLRLQQILNNLLSNAIKFTSKGEILVQVRVIEHINDDNVMLIFSVKDTGIGISEEQMKILFQPFMQADISTTRKYGGTGLGLTISHKLVDLLKGNIVVESVPGAGSIFYFTVPLGIQKDKDNHYSIPYDEIKGLNVLVVDDNPTSRKVLKEYLEDFSFQVMTVQSGFDAINLLNKNELLGDIPFDLILMDWHMEGMDGIETIKQIRQKIKLSNNIKFIMVTAYGRDDVFLQAQSVNIDAFLIKPFSQSILFDSILSIFNLDDTNNPENKVKSHSKTTEQLNSIRGAKILIVEDNDNNQQVAKEILEQENFWITIANHGAEAIELIPDHNGKSKFDLILMDLQMPVMDGYYATKHIREQLKLTNLPIIAMTAEAIKGIQDKILKAGMNDYISKPFDPQELLNCLINWIPKGNREYFMPQEDDQDNVIVEENIPDLDGININIGLLRTNNNKKLFQHLIFQFNLKNYNFVKNIRQNVLNNHRELVQRMVHTLKGVSGSIGAVNLQKQLIEFEKVILKNDLNMDALNPYLQDIDNEMNRIFYSITQYENNMQKSKSHVSRNQYQFDPQQIKQLLIKLEENLKNYSTQANDILTQVKNILIQLNLWEQFKHIETFINNYLFEKAIIVLHDIQKLVDEKIGVSR